MYRSQLVYRESGKSLNYKLRWVWMRWLFALLSRIGKRIRMVRRQRWRGLSRVGKVTKTWLHFLFTIHVKNPRSCLSCINVNIRKLKVNLAWRIGKLKWCFGKSLIELFDLIGTLGSEVSQQLSRPVDGGKRERRLVNRFFGVNESEWESQMKKSK